ncbi:MAG: AAA family ATPase [Bacteroidales bacterium]|nr:AAA family ATPase [Candidatus Latescibacterota bacterium]
MELSHFVQIDFYHFKAFRKFRLALRPFNILVGPNNSGKSTVLAAFRILAAGMRTAGARKPVIVAGPNGDAPGYVVDLSNIAVADENLFYDYDESHPATVTFKLDSGNKLQLYFPKREICYLFAEHKTVSIRTPAKFRLEFNCPIGFVPILGPVEHNELLYQKEAARQALFNYRAARNFRNIWYHYRESFEDFKRLLARTWPGMEIEAPTIDTTHGKPRLVMFCPEKRIPREIAWAGFGFQVWCQMLTHLVQSKEKAIFLIDEPDIYLHSDLQRQLLGLLRDLGPDILVATHSTEIVTEAESDDIVLINKNEERAKRIRQPSDLSEVFEALGSNLNPILTQLAKTKSAVFVEGKDFIILGKFARRLNEVRIGNRSDFAVIPVEGFNPDRIRTLIKGIETTLGTEIASMAILDRDFRCNAERKNIEKACGKFCGTVIVHNRKEVENYLLVIDALEKAAERRVKEQVKRTGKEIEYTRGIAAVLDEYCDEVKQYIQSQQLASRRQFERNCKAKKDESVVFEECLVEFEKDWSTAGGKYNLIPGKEALSRVNKHLQDSYGVMISPAAIIDAMQKPEIPEEVVELVGSIQGLVAREE